MTRNELLQAAAFLLCKKVKLFNPFLILTNTSRYSFVKGRVILKNVNGCDFSHLLSDFQEIHINFFSPAIV